MAPVPSVNFFTLFFGQILWYSNLSKSKIEGMTIIKVNVVGRGMMGMGISNRRVVRASIIFGAALFFSLTVASPASAAQIPKYINFQGQLTDSSGAKVNGSRSVTFGIYNVATGGSPLYTEVQSVVLSNGVGSALLGSVTPLNLPFDTHYYLGITISGDAEMTPRIQLSASAYAFTAQELADSAKAQGTLAVTDTLAVGDTRLVVTKAGSVGIGTASPADKLHISGGNILLDNNQLIYFKDVGGTPRQMIQFNTATDLLINGGNAFHTRIGLGGGNVYVTNGLSADSLAVGDTRLLVLKSGRVGISTASPGSQLDVISSYTGEEGMLVSNTNTGASAYTQLSVAESRTLERHVGLIYAPSTYSNPATANSGALVTGSGATNGLYFQTVAAAPIRFVPNSVEAARITSAGRIGIGTTSPTDTLHVVGKARFTDTVVVDSSITASIFYGSGAGLTGISGDGTGGWTVSGDTNYKLTGNVGIGTASPTAKLHIRGNGVTENFLRLTDTITSGGDYYISPNGGATGNLGVYDITGGITRFVIAPGGNVGINTVSPGESLTVNGSFSADTMAIGDTKLVVLATGNVGIGTGTPTFKLDVSGKLRAQGGAAASRIEGTAANPLLELWGSNSDANKQFLLWVPNDDRLRFDHDNGTGEIMSMWDNGNVTTAGKLGVGIASPTDSLHVVGKAHITDTLVVDSSITASIFYGSGAGLTGVAASSLAPANLTMGISSDSIIDGTIATADLSSGAVTSSRIASGAVTSTEIAASAVNSAKILYGAVGTSALDSTIKVRDSFQVGIDSFYVAPGGGVGVGTNNPMARLHASHSSADVARFTVTSGGQTNLILDPQASFSSARIQGLAVGLHTDLALIMGGTTSERVRFSQDGSIGVGTTTPSDSFHVLGAIRSADSIVAMKNLVVDTTTLFVDGSANRVGIGTLSPADSLAVDGSFSADTMAIGETKLVVVATGNVGVGTTDPQALLDVNGMLRINRTLEVGSGSGLDMQIGHRGANAIDFFTNNTTRMSLSSTGNLSIGTGSPGGKLHVLGNIIVRDTFVVQDTAFIVKESGRVGIGTATPTDSLTVAGKLKVTDTMLVGETTTTKDLRVSRQLIIDAPTMESGTILVGNSSGRASYEGPVGASVRRTSVQSITDSTATAISFDVEDFDSGNLYITVTQPTRLTAPSQGLYMITGSVAFAGSGAGVRQIYIKKNGSTRIATGGAAGVAGTFSNNGSVATVAFMNAGDYAELVVVQTSGGNLDVLSSENYSPVFTMAKVR